MKEKHPITDDTTTSTATGVSRQSKITHITKSKIKIKFDATPRPLSSARASAPLFDRPARFHPR
jgi:hypothetical protein